MDNVVKLYWTVNETAKALQVSRAKLRYWIQEFKLDAGFKKGHTRKFNQAQFERIKMVKNLFHDQPQYTKRGVKLILMYGKNWAVNKLLAL